MIVIIISIIGFSFMFPTFTLCSKKNKYSSNSKNPSTMSRKRVKRPAPQVSYTPIEVPQSKQETEGKDGGNVEGLKEEVPNKNLSKEKGKPISKEKTGEKEKKEKKKEATQKKQKSVRKTAKPKNEEKDAEAPVENDDKKISEEGINKTDKTEEPELEKKKSELSDSKKERLREDDTLRDTKSIGK
ncbi:uncharacterized protein CELE_Y59H11AM.4 [Caenorhabditis elegans]|uniref:Uncharacterized protein n=1 Tax=Caenorhabditis elegans TaxID=6239 RepID=Q95XU8_CAEEL|nr:Uncharacterized protein CELE_Y59H11AM.4 [Caenorhabditis elegans]CCD74089.1 Uncharacterized protein CELE_Y59H11AM.4 [Caenorhabditis elegans]|eukprot:NP_501463.1 Uncharacterized protein CELE_Y59H11AM.4 [Caenorhabditis elegans]